MDLSSAHPRSRGAERTASDERGEPSEAEINAFGAWYESQPEEWVAFLDELGKSGSGKQRER